MLRSSRTVINQLIMEKLDKYVKDENKKNFLRELLEKELVWYSSQVSKPDYKKDFPKILDNYFPFKEEENKKK